MSCLYAPSALPKLDVKDKVKLQLTTTLKFLLCAAARASVCVSAPSCLDRLRLDYTRSRRSMLQPGPAIVMRVCLVAPVVGNDLTRRARSFTPLLSRHIFYFFYFSRQPRSFTPRN